MFIREYEKQDREEILTLLRLNTPRYFSPNEEKDLIYYFDNHAQNYYVVEIDGKIYGCGGFNLSKDSTIGALSWDIVHPEWQGKGIGSELTRFRINKMKSIDGVTVISVRTSQLVYPFYQKFGLQLREVVPDYWDLGFDLYSLDCDVNSVIL